MILKDFIEKALDYDLDRQIVLDNGNGSSSDIIDIIECTNEKNEEIVSVRVGK